MSATGNVGYATMEVIPVAKGFQAALSKQVTPAVTQTASKSGESFGTKFSSGVAGKLGTALKGAGIAAGVALVGGLISAAGQRDVGANLQASLGLDASVSAKFGAAAGLAYKQNYGESVAQVGDTIKAAFQNGIIGANDSKDAIAGVVAQIETYAKVSGTDAVESTRAVAQMIKTGIAKDATQAFDLLTRGQQLGINKSEDLLDTFNEYGTQFRKLGIDGPQALGLMNQALATGARDSDLAADALKEFSIRAIDGSKSTAEGFKAIGLNAKTMSDAIARGGPAANAALQTTIDHLRDVKDPAARSAAAVALFGTQAEDLGLALYSFNPRTAVESLDGFAGATDKANKALASTPSAQIEQFTRTLKQGFVETLGGTVIPALTKASGDFRAKFGPAISEAGTKLKEAVPHLTTLATEIIGKLVPGIAAGVKALGDFGKFLGDHEKTAKALGIAVGVLGAAFVTAKVGIAAYTVATKAYAAGQVIASTAVKAAGIATTVWSGITKAAAAAQWLLNAALIANPIGLVVLGIAALIAVIVLVATKTKFFQTVFGAVWGAIKTVAGAVAGFFTSKVLPIFQAVLSGIGTALSALGAVWAKIWGVFGPLVKAVWDFIKAVIGLAIALVVAVVTAQIKALAKTWSVIWGGISTAASKVWGVISGAASKVFSAMSAAVSKIWNAMSGAISKVAGAIWGKISGPINTVKNGISSAFNTAKDLGSKAFSSLYSAISGVAGSIASKVSGVVSAVKGAFSGAAKWLYNAGADIIKGLISGITSKISAVTSKLKELTNKIPDWKGPIQRDRVLLTPAGKSIMDSLVQGFEARFPAVRSALGGLTNDLSQLPISSASNVGALPNARGRIADGRNVQITVNGQDDPEATARIVGRKLAGAGV
jgi:phage-related protein